MADEHPGVPVSYRLATPLQTVKLETTAKGTVMIEVTISDPDPDQAAAKCRAIFDGLQSHYYAPRTPAKEGEDPADYWSAK